jgi:hypothetical protein
MLLNRIKPIDIIICDDIREEKNGKYTLAGVFPAGISVPQLPANILLAVWIVFECHEKGNYDIEVEVRGPAPDQKISIQAGFQNHLGPNARAPLAITKLYFPISQIGDASIFFRQKDDKEWVRLKTFFIELQNAENQIQSKP